MTPAHWLAHEKTMTLLKSLRSRSTDRKLRLFACACGRRVEHLGYRGGTADSFDACRDADRRAIEVAEQVADGLRPTADLIAASRPLATGSIGRFVTRSAAKTAAAEVVNLLYLLAIPPHEAKTAKKLLKLLGQVELLREIFGDIRPVRFSGQWRTSTAVALAHQMYESLDFSAMPILADALQDAGCDSAEILDHCRGPGPHVRGCWVVDLVLAKE
jgi:hypothetical protein